MKNVDLSKVKVFLFYLLLILITYGLSNALNNIDFDLWSRLIQGKYVIETGSVMYKDILSFTPTHTWYDPEWLSSAFLYLIINKFSLVSVTVLKFLLILLSIIFITVGVHCTYDYKYSKLHLEYFIVTLVLLFIGGTSGMFLRCQLFTYVMIPIFIAILELVSKNYDTKKSLPYLISIPFLMLLWLNIHGGCIAGVGILILFIVGRILNKKPIKKFLYITIPTFLVFFINPWGYKYISFLLHSTTLDRSWIIEWQSLIGHDLLYKKETMTILILSMLLYLVVLILKRFKNINYSKMLILLVTYYLAWSHYKHVPIYAICSGIYLYDDFIFLFKKIFDFIYKKINFDETCQKYVQILKDTLIYILIGAISLYLILVFPISNSLKERTLGSFPFNLVEFLKENNIKGKMFSPYFYSSYISYKTYPNIKIFIDGRQEQVWDYDIFDRVMFFMYKMESKNPIIEDYEPDMLLVENGWLYELYIKENIDKYKLIYDDRFYRLYIKKVLAKNHYKQVNIDQQYAMDTILDTDIDFKKR